MNAKPTAEEKKNWLRETAEKIHALTAGENPEKALDFAISDDGMKVLGIEYPDWFGKFGREYILGVLWRMYQVDENRRQLQSVRFDWGNLQNPFMFQIKDWIEELVASADVAGLWVVRGQSVIDGQSYDVLYLQRWEICSHIPNTGAYAQGVIDCQYIPYTGFVGTVDFIKALRSLRSVTEGIIAKQQKMEDEARQ